MYFDTLITAFSRRHIVSAASTKKMELQAHFNTMCFSFTGKTVAADANRLQDLHEFLWVGDEDSFRRFIENSNPSSVAEQSRINNQRIIIHSTTNLTYRDS